MRQGFQPLSDCRNTKKSNFL